MTAVSRCIEGFKYRMGRTWDLTWSPIYFLKSFFADEKYFAVKVLMFTLGSLMSPLIMAIIFFVTIPVALFAVISQAISMPFQLLYAKIVDDCCTSPDEADEQRRFLSEEALNDAVEPVNQESDTAHPDVHPWLASRESNPEQRDERSEIATQPTFFYAAKPASELLSASIGAAANQENDTTLELGSVQTSALN